MEFYRCCLFVTFVGLTVDQFVWRDDDPLQQQKQANEGLTLVTSAFESRYGDQFTLSTQLMKPNYLVILPTDAAPQFR